MRSGEDGQSEEAHGAELDAARRQLSAYRDLIEEVPQIYERKFRERLEPIHARNRQLLEEGRRLEEQLARMPLPTSDIPVPAALPATGGPERPPIPFGRPWHRWLAIGSLGAALLLGYGAFHSLRQPRTAQAPATTPRPASPPAGTRAGGAASEQASPMPGELRLKTRGLSWMEVRNFADTTLFIGNLQGARSFSLERGLRISAGRPDLVMVQRHGEPARPLGGILEIGWHTFAPTNPAGESASTGGDTVPGP